MWDPHCAVVFWDLCPAVPSSLKRCFEFVQNRQISVELRTVISFAETTGI